MKQIEKILVVILALTIISTVGAYLSSGLLVRFYGPAEYAQMSLFSKTVATIPLFFRILVNICVAAWLFVVAREHRAQPVLWFVFGIFFGLIAIVLFYLIRIYDALSPELKGQEKT